MKLAPKIVSGLVVKTFNFSFELIISNLISQPKDFPIQFFALISLFQANLLNFLIPLKEHLKILLY